MEKPSASITSAVAPDNRDRKGEESDYAGVIETRPEDRASEPRGNNSAGCSVVRPHETYPEMKESQSESPDPSLEMSLDDALASVDVDCTKISSLWDAMFAVLYFWSVVAMIYFRFSVLTTYEQSHAISAALGLSDTEAPACGSPVGFHDIKTISDTFEWLTDRLVPSVFVMGDYNGSLLYPEHWGYLDLANTVVGPVIFKMRRKPTSYNSTPDLFISFDTNSSVVVNMLREKKDDGDWLDVSTQSLGVTILTYNEQLDLYARTELWLEFTTKGYIEKTVSVVSAEQASSLVVVVEISALIVTFLLVLRGLTSFRFFPTAPRWSLTEQPTSDWKTGIIKGRPLWEGVIVFSAYEMSAAFWGFSVVLPLITVPYSDLASLRLPGQTWSWDSIWRILNKFGDGGYMTYLGTIVVFLLGLQVVIVFNVERRLSIFTRTIANAFRQALAFFLIFSVIFMTFVASGTLFFGSRVKEFSSFRRSMESCINMLFGEFGVDNIQDLDGSFVFYWAYMLVVGLLMLNIILAIVVSAYEVVSADNNSNEANLEFHRMATDFVWEVCMVLHDIKTRNQWSKARHNPLSLLKATNPGYVQRKLEAYKHQGEIVQQLTHIEVVFGGRIRPRLLKEVLSGVLYIRDNRATDDPDASASLGPRPDDMITPKTLREMFPSANLTEQEARATLKHIYEGTQSAIQARSNQEAKASHPRWTHRLSAGANIVHTNGLEHTRPSQTPSCRKSCDSTALSDVKANVGVALEQDELKELNARLAEVESKLGKLDSLEGKLNLLLQRFDLNVASQ